MIRSSNTKCLLVCTFSNFLVPVLVTAHAVNSLDLCHKQSFVNEGYKSDYISTELGYFLAKIMVCINKDE